MSAELQARHDCLDTETFSAEILEAAVSACLPTEDASSDRALELVTPEEITAAEIEADDGEGTPEVETGRVRVLLGSTSKLGTARQRAEEIGRPPSR